MWTLGLRPRYSFSGNICFKFSAFFLCSVGYKNRKENFAETNDYSKIYTYTSKYFRISLQRLYDFAFSSLKSTLVCWNSEQYVAYLRLESLFVMQRVYGLSYGLEQLWSLVDSHCQASLNQSIEYQYILTASIKEIQLKFTTFSREQMHRIDGKGIPFVLK